MLSYGFGQGVYCGQQSLGRAGTAPSIEVQGGVPIALKRKATISPRDPLGLFRGSWKTYPVA
jgi:hypothetical protein